MPPLSLLIKPVSSACNLRCTYCFYHDVAQNRARRSYGNMSLETLEILVRRALAWAEGECSFAFQGGEPTLAGLPFFQELIALQERYNTKNLRIHNAIQTNGCGLGEDWAAFFAQHRFLVGVSLDGDGALHDLFRKTPEGEGSFAEIRKTLRLFDRYGVTYNILTVVTRQMARHIDRVYRFYRKNGFRYLQFIPCLNPLGKPEGDAPHALDAESYAGFLKRLFDLWYRYLTAGEPVSIRQFDNFVQMLLGYPPESCDMRGVCSLQHVVEADGSVYPCDFYVLDGYRLGNLRTEGFAELAEAGEASGFVRSSRQIHPRCRECRYYQLCRGGCRRWRAQAGDGIPSPDDEPGLNLLCRAYEEFFDYAMPRLTKLACRLAAGQLNFHMNKPEGRVP